MICTGGRESSILVPHAGRRRAQESDRIKLSMIQLRSGAPAALDRAEANFSGRPAVVMLRLEV